MTYRAIFVTLTGQHIGIKDVCPLLTLKLYCQLFISTVQRVAISGLSRTYKLKFKDFRWPTLFSSIYKTLNLEKKLHDIGGCVGIQWIKQLQFRDCETAFQLICDKLTLAFNGKAATFLFRCMLW